MCKMLHIQLLFFLLTLTEKTGALCVSSAGEDTQVCLTPTGNTNMSVCCKSLAYPIKQLVENRKIAINLLTDITLEEAIVVRNFKSFMLEGFSISRISCIGHTSGIAVQNSGDIVFKNITFERCSMLKNSSTSKQDNPEESELIYVSIFIINCTNLILERVTVCHSEGTGTVLYNTRGNVTIKESNFESNLVNPHNMTYAGGGGLVIEFTGCELLHLTDCSAISEIVGARYTIEDSKFVRNSAHQKDSKRISHNLKLKKSYAGLGRGGGLFISMRGQAHGNSFVIRNCDILGNTAGTFGGGMYLSIGQGNSYNNSVDISGCNFVNNTCTNYGGGGLFLSLFTYTALNLVNNKVLMNHVNFSSNTARIGGGLSVLVQRGIKIDNTLLFYDCNWLGNNAELGSAVDISPNWFDKAVDAIGNGRLLPRIEFCNCSFVGNYIVSRRKQNGDGFLQGLATFLVTHFVVSFGGSTEFYSNNGTGLYLIAGLVKVLSGSQLKLKGNVAQDGGAMVLYGFSVIYMEESSSVHLENNEAEKRGGALYVESTDLHEQIYSRSCFLETLSRGEDMFNKNVTISFVGNRAKTGEGNSLYASSLFPCATSCSNTRRNITSGKDIDCLANISGLHDKDIRTDAFRFEIDHDSTIMNKIIPGKDFGIPIKAFDELNQLLLVHYHASLKFNNSVRQDNQSFFGLYGVDSNMTLYNSKGQVGTNILLLSRRQTTLEINVTTIECPPGHVMNNGGECTCELSRFQGISKCDKSNKTAYISPGYWIGLCSDGKQCTGYCAPGFCRTKDMIHLTERINDTHKLICNNNRKGKLCGRCLASHSVYYHSESYRCGKETLCAYGILFYVLSEILPLTIIFLAVIAFNISFTAGSLNGIILFAQVYDILIIYSKEFLPKGVSVLFHVSTFFFSLVNLNYFNIEGMSFCLWKGATTLDIISWKYVTIAYALFLIFATVRLLNTTKCKQICIWWRPHTLKNAVIHGFTTFLVMSYSQCAKVSFSLLVYDSLLKHDLTLSEKSIWYSGEINFFDKTHTVYAVPALVFMLSIVILPPLLLILYPLSFKVLALCKLSELKIVNLISRWIPVQLFDSFQSCFKDKYRFMSGLYFLYRVIPLLFLAFGEFTAFYFMVEIFLILVLAIHCLLQPYKERLHNQIDCLIFTNLAIINGISFYISNSEGTRRVNSIKRIGQAATSIQLILIFLPLLYIGIFSLVYVVKKLKRLREEVAKQKRGEDSDHTLLDSMYLPPLRDEDDPYSRNNFHKMN